jgi:mannobiose 2-epimerase
MLRFIDREHGGVFWSLHADGTPLDTKKQTYAIAFAIYGLAEYVRLTHNQEALDAVIRLFNDLEDHAFDAGHVGYIEALTRDWKPISDMRLSEQDENGAFTMNTHLHVLEAYTNLYRVYKDPRVARQLRVLIDIFVNRLFNPETGHLGLFFDDEWKPLNEKMVNDQMVNKFSPGHDIEAAWLLHEALEVFGDPILLQETLPICQQLAQAAEDGILNEYQWWCYAEAVVGYVDQWQLNQKALPAEAAVNLEMAEVAWEFIRSHLIDREHGEFYWAILPDGTPDMSNDKAGFWKCPYHNSRMCIELIERLK